MANMGEEVILVRKETTPEDIHGMKSAEGVLTALGGMTSHAAVVARGMGKCCVSGCTAAEVDAKSKVLKVGVVSRWLFSRLQNVYRVIENVELGGFVVDGRRGQGLTVGGWGQT